MQMARCTKWGATIPVLRNVIVNGLGADRAYIKRLVFDTNNNTPSTISLFMSSDNSVSSYKSTVDVLFEIGCSQDIETLYHVVLRNKSIVAFNGLHFHQCCHNVILPGLVKSSRTNRHFAYCIHSGGELI